MWVVTNIDFEHGSVSDVYGPFKTEAEAAQMARDHAQAEYDRAANEHRDAKLLDELESEGEIEVEYTDAMGEETGCLYQVLELEKA
jgi:hypothetical protein